MWEILKTLRKKTPRSAPFYSPQKISSWWLNLLPNEDIGEEMHPAVDQFLRIESGEGKVIMNGEETALEAGSAIIVPAGTKHNIINTSPTNPMKLYTVYSPPNHPDGKVHKTKAEALADTEDHV